MSLRWPLIVLGSIALGWLLSWLGVPAAWILGAIIASAGYALRSGTELEVPPVLMSSARGFIGMMAGLPLLAAPWGQTASYLLPAFTAAVVSVAVAFGCGLLMARTPTGILSFMPGGASMLPILAKDMGADYRIVALTQYLRLLSISFLLPLVASFVWAKEALNHEESSSAATWWSVLLILGIALGGEWLARKLRLPVPFLSGPILLVVLAGYLVPDPVVLDPPEVLKVLAFLCIGWMCGGSLNVSALKTFGRQLPWTMLLIGVLVATCAGISWVLAAWTGVSYLDAFLAASPGALETVLALSDEAGSGPIVVTTQLLRLILIMVIAAWLPKLFPKKKRAVRGSPLPPCDQCG